MIETGIDGLPRSTVRVERTAHGIELYFPPLRTPDVAIPLAAFGAIAAVIPGMTIVALLPAAVASPGGVLSAILLAGFVLPFALFGLVFIALGIYIVGNSLTVRIGGNAIETTRTVFGIALRARRMTYGGTTIVEPRIASRHQSLFSAHPLYDLLARDQAGTTRLVVAESLRGEALMARVKALIESVR